MKILDTITEYYNYFLEGLSLVIKFIFDFTSKFPIPTGIVLFIFGIKLYLKMISKDPIDYNSKNSRHEIRSRGDTWMFIIYIIIMGAILIVSNV